MINERGDTVAERRTEVEEPFWDDQYLVSTRDTLYRAQTRQGVSDD